MRRASQQARSLGPSAAAPPSAAVHTRSSAGLLVKWKSVCKEGHGRNSPSPRQGHSATALPGKECIVVFGGEGTIRPGSTVSKVFHNDAFRFDCKSRKWSSLVCTGDIPSPRAYHTAVLVGNDKLVIFGGIGKSGSKNTARMFDCYRLSLGTLVWESIHFQGVLSGSRLQVRKSVTFPDIPGKVFLFGGAHNAEAELTLAGTGADGIVHAVADLDLLSLTVTAAAGSVPSPRSNYSCVTYAERVILFGGFDGTKRFNDVYIFNPRSLQWKLQETTGDIPSGRYKHSACVYGQFMYVVGGYSVQWLNQVYILDMQSWHWFAPSDDVQDQEKLRPNVKGPDDAAASDAAYFRPRESHTTTGVGRFAYIFGGWSWPNCMSDVFRFNMSRLGRACAKLAQVSLDARAKKSGRRKSSRRVGQIDKRLPIGRGGKNQPWLKNARSASLGNNLGSESIPADFVLTAASSTANRNAAHTPTEDQEEPDKRKHKDSNTRSLRKNANLLRSYEKRSAARLPNIRQLTSTSTDSEEEEESNVDAVESHSGTSHANAKQSLMPAQAALSPVIRNSSTRRRRFQRIVTQRAGERIGEERPLSKDVPWAEATHSAEVKISEAQRKLIKSEVDRHVQAAVQSTRREIESQEKRKEKAAAGVAALRDMLSLLNSEKLALSQEVAKEEMLSTDSNLEEKMKKIASEEKKAIDDRDNRRALLQASTERIQMLRARLNSQTTTRNHITEVTEGINRQIDELKLKLDKDHKDGSKIDAESDSLGQDVHTMQDLVEQQKEMRVALAQKLQSLRESRTSLRKQIEEQAKALIAMEKEEQRLREAVAIMVSELAGPGIATEEKPYELMHASLLGTPLKAAEDLLS